MCVVCGCSDTGSTGAPAGSATGPSVNAATGDLHYGAGLARVSVPGLSPARAIQIETDVLGENNRIAAANRVHFLGHGVTALNLVSSPGSGKTSLLVATLQSLRRQHPGLAMGVIEGDQQTAFDADRIRATGVPAIQVNTGKGCHLDAPMVAEAFSRLPLHAHVYGDSHQNHDHHAHHTQHDHPHGHGHDHVHGHEHHHPDHAPARALLFIENVGNLVCPAMWDLGEAAKVAVLSVTEGEDKPLKYPDMFAAARLMVLSKTDLLPHVDFDVERCIAYARQVNPTIEVLQLSSRSGQGMQSWLDWLLALQHGGRPAQAAQAALPGEDGQGGESAALRRRVAELEARLRAAGLAA